MGLQYNLLFADFSIRIIFSVEKIIVRNPFYRPKENFPIKTTGF